MNQLSKKQLRAHYRAARADMLPEQRDAQTREICAHILQSPMYRAASCVLLYAATEGEIDLSCVAADAWERGKVVAYPRCLDKAGNMAFFAVESPEQLEKGSFGILEPRLDCPLWQPADDALCVVPALAVDKKGMNGEQWYIIGAMVVVVLFANQNATHHFLSMLLFFI